MSSEIRTNLLKSRTGLSTVTLSDTGPVVTGIATFGVTTKIDGGNNVINVGTALTIGHTQGVQFHTQNLHSTGFEVNQVNASGIITASSYRGDGSQLTGISAGFSPDAQGNLVAGTNAGDSFSGTDANNNVLLGLDAGTAITTADGCVFIGANAGEVNTTRSDLVSIGANSGTKVDNAYGFTAVGDQAGKNHQTGSQSTYIGKSAGRSFTGSAANNTIIGSECHYNATTGSNNVSIGKQTMSLAGDASGCTAVGTDSLKKSSQGGSGGDNNTALGFEAGDELVSGSNCLILGYNAQASSTSVSNEITLGDANITKLRVPGIDFILKDNGGTPTQGHILTVDGSGEAGFAAPAGPTINNNANTRVITASGNANEFDAQASLTFSNSNNDPKLTISGTGHAQLNLTSTSGTDHTGINFGDSDDINAGMIQYSNTGNTMQFHTNGSEKLRINSNGKIKIYNTITSSSESHFEIGDTQGIFDFEMSDASGGSDFIKHVKKRFIGKNTYGLTITSRSTLSGSYTKAGEASIKFYYPSAGGGAQAGGQLEFWTNQNGYAGTTEAKRMQISNSGNIGAPNGNNIYNASDERLKEDMVELTNGLDKIKKLKPISFKWKDGWDECMSGKKEYGFGAQTTQVVDEMLVEPFGTEDTLLNGEVIKNPLRVNEKYIVPLLVKAIQEQQEQIEILKQENFALRVRVTNLEDN